MAKRIVPVPAPQQNSPLDAIMLGQFIRARRTQSGMGIHDTAALCGVAVDTLTKIENARGDVMLSSILKVCRMLGIELQIVQWKE
jgi:transcriptional regulator with XRE-family HTH domain